MTVETSQLQTAVLSFSEFFVFSFLYASCQESTGVVVLSHFLVLVLVWVLNRGAGSREGGSRGTWPPSSKEGAMLLQLLVCEFHT